MKWLHFTDFHIGTKSAPYIDVLASQLDAVERLCVEEGTIDFVILGGDVAYSGIESEYEIFEKNFLSRIKKLPALTDASFFIVPGNHDKCCADALPLTWDMLRDRKDVFFAEDENGKRTRQPLIKAFDAYNKFVKRNNLISPNPEIEVSLLHKDTKLPINILMCNTSFLSDKNEKSSDPITPIPIQSIRNQISKIDKTRPTFIVGHHSPSSFRREQVGQFTTLLHDKNAIYLHGHEHSSDASFHGDGMLKTIGFGAVYANSIIGDSDPTYKNIFTLCKLTSQLEIKAFSWESKPGSWIDTTEIEFNTCLSNKNEKGEKIRTASIPILSTNSEAKGVQILTAVPRSNATPTKLIPIGMPNRDTWLAFVKISEQLKRVIENGAYKISQSEEQEGISSLIVSQGDKRHLLICLSGINHIIAHKEVESYNTRLDSEDLSSITVITFGKFSDEARELYLKFSRNKSIEILTNKDITANYHQILTKEQMLIVGGLDSAVDQVSVLIDENNVYVLNVRFGSVAYTFSVYGKDGSMLRSSHALVSSLRNSIPEFSKMNYVGEPVGQFVAEEDFDEQMYFKACYATHNVVKYAGLASIGLPLSEMAFEDLYVDTTATEIDEKKPGRLEDMLGDHISAFPMSEALKTQLKKELLDSVNPQEQERSDARNYYQQFGAVLIVGDPGSGKTCFVKHELLSYCKAAAKRLEKVESETWYSSHYPVMIQLSEAVEEMDFDKIGLIEVASRLLARRGMSVSANKLRDLSKMGQVAWFFDGLDEVVSIERRALIVDLINKLIEETVKLGNRVIVTSRPAAIQVVNILPTLRKLEIQGLSDDDIRLLAKRILKLKVGETENGLLIHEDKQALRHESIVTQLIADCRQNPGVARLAQNPLLLTLLIMIYANAGSASAKRHVIYEQAIQTLATVRGREAGFSPMAASDIRFRLGAVALSIYEKDTGILPSLSEVIATTRQAISEQRAGEATEEEAREFIRKVAEWTGLIAIEKRQSLNGDQSIVTFMHHSFLEYFAAYKLYLNIKEVKIEDLVLKPRWREILTILAGIVGDSGDIAPVLRRFMCQDVKSTIPDTDAKLLTFAIDSALECEVPSEEAQYYIAKQIESSVLSGPIKRDPWVRSEIGHRLKRLVETCGDLIFGKSLVTLIRHPDPDVSAAGIVLSGYILNVATQSETIVSAICEIAGRREDAISCAICESAARSRALQNEKIYEVFERCLNKSKRTKAAALEAASSIPEWTTRAWSEVVKHIADDDWKISLSASTASIRAGLNADVISLNSTKRDLLIKALYLCREHWLDEEVSLPKIKISTVEHLWDSAKVEDRILALQLLPLSIESEQYIYERLMTIVREFTSREEVVAALSSLRISNAITVYKTSDLKIISDLLDARTIDVREEAIKLLGCFGGSVDAVEALLARDLRDLDFREYRAIIRALARTRVLTSVVARKLIEQVHYYVEPQRTLDKERIDILLAALQYMGKTTSKDIVEAVKDIIDDFRKPQELKRRAITCLPSIIVPSPDNINYISEIIRKGFPGLEGAYVHVPTLLSKKCRESIEYVGMSVESLSVLLPILYKLYEQIARREVNDTNENLLTTLRTGIAEIQQLIVTFDEFLSKESALSPK